MKGLRDKENEKQREVSQLDTGRGIKDRHLLTSKLACPECLKLKRPIIPRVGEIMELLELSFSDFEYIKWYEQFGKKLESFLKT